MITIIPTASDFATASTSSPVAQLTEYDTGSGQGGGLFNHDGGSTATIDNGLVFPALTGRWIRDDGSWDLTNFGVQKGSNADQHTLIQAAFNSGESIHIPAQAGSPGVAIPDFSYRSDQPLTVDHTIAIRGDSSGHSHLRFPSTGDGLVVRGEETSPGSGEYHTVFGCVFQDFGINRIGNATSGTSFLMDHLGYSKLENVHCFGAYEGFDFRDCVGTSIIHCVDNQRGRTTTGNFGFRIIGGTNLRFFGGGCPASSPLNDEDIPCKDDGLLINGIDTAYFFGWHANHMRRDVRLIPLGNRQLSDVQFVGCYMDRAYGYNVLLSGSSTKPYHNVGFHSTLLRQPEGTNEEAGGGQPTTIGGLNLAISAEVEDVKVRGCRLMQAALGAVFVNQEATDIDITANTFTDVNTNNSASSIAVISIGATDFKIRDNEFNSAGAGTDYAITLNSTSTDGEISGNDFRSVTWSTTEINNAASSLDTIGINRNRYGSSVPKVTSATIGSAANAVLFTGREWTTIDNTVAAQTVDNIVGGIEGDEVYFLPAAANPDNTFRHVGGGTGNLRMHTHADVMPTSVSQAIGFKKRSTLWYQIGL